MLATVEKISSVRTHPNADTLDIVQVLGFECITKRDSLRVNDRVVFIQPDSLLPADRPWCADLLKYTSRGRVKAVRLRGEWSTGIILPVAEVHSVLDGLCLDEPIDVGEEVSAILGITKYEPPLPKNLQAKGSLPFGIPKTDETLWQNLRDMPWGIEVDVTLKVDGSSFTAYCVLPGDFPPDASDGVQGPRTGITSRTLELKIFDPSEGTNHWIEAARQTLVLDRLSEYCERHGVSLALRGEVYGPGVQAMAINPHSREPRSVAFFSTWNIRERRYEGPESEHYFLRICDLLGLETVPLLEESAVLTPALVRHYGDEIEKINGEPFEGVVLKGARGWSAKVINKYYDSKK